MRRLVLSAPEMIHREKTEGARTVRVAGRGALHRLLPEGGGLLELPEMGVRPRQHGQQLRPIEVPVSGIVLGEVLEGLHVADRLRVRAPVQSATSRGREVPTGLRSQRGGVGVGEVVGELVGVPDGGRSPVRLHRFGHASMEPASPGESELPVQDLPDEGVGEVVHDLTTLGALVEHPVLRELLHRGEEPVGIETR